ncbi:hypothetical protein EF989_22485 [Salmonella enterica]|nr:hypothetical protein [Salmonella enterica]EBE2623253.1 hypothetical protein [Salmonella enterica]EBS4421617.1 hypothetical protein [Salmonella enterica subsp. enterica serovar Corvallis]ECH4838105.1 hypothetical protein [Salmonella enterica]ECY7054855.1 hypothetical protein [Salmonella enterica]
MYFTIIFSSSFQSVLKLSGADVQKIHNHCKAAGTNPPCCVCQKYSQNKALPEAGRTYPVLYGH